MSNPSAQAAPLHGMPGGLSGLPLVLLLAAIQLSAFSDRFLITLVAQPLKEALALSDAELGFLQGSAFVLLNALVLPVVGRFADRGHRRTILIGSILIWTAATLACGVATSFPALLVCRLLLGLGQAGIAPAAISLMAHRLDRKQLGIGISCLTAGASLGRSLALLAGGAVLAWLAASGGWFGVALGVEEPWRSLFIVSGLPNLALLAGVLLVAEPRRDAAAPNTSVGRAMAWLVRRRGRYLPIVVASVAAMLVSQTLTAWAPAFYGRVFGLAPAKAGVLLGSVVLVAAPAGHLFGGRLLGRMSGAHRVPAALRMLAIGLLLVVPATLVMTLGASLPVSVAGFAALVAVLGFTSPPALTGVQWLTPLALRGQVTAIFISAVTLVSIGLGPVLLGVLNDRVFGPNGVAHAMMAMFAPIGLLGAAVAFGSGRPR